MTDPDLLLVRGAGRRAAWLAAALVAVSFLLCAGLVLVIVVTGEDRAARTELAAAVARADDVSDPPAGISLVLRRPDGGIETTPGAPAALPYRPDIVAVLRTGAPAVQERDIETPAGDFRIRTERRVVSAGTEVVQAASSLRAQESERARLFGGLAAAGAVALLAAGALGVVTGRQTVRGLVAALRRQRQFVSDASHELRTPLAVLSTRAQMLRRHLDSVGLDDAARRVLTADADRLLVDSTRLADVVEDLLAASEPRAASTERVELQASAADAVAGLALLGADRQVALELTGLDGAEEQAGPVEIEAGSSAVRRSLVAVIDNAVRHSPAGGTVRVGCGIRGGSAVVTVSDSGPGIPDPVRAQLFDRFASGDRRADDEGSPATRRRYGLGLALVADTMHRHGGDVAVVTGPGGTTFTLTFPLAARA
ncbi:MAG: two-component system, OmpR family, sensor kinase [Blastococcus sp.]|nr:two-component system, OmpR family, sensor kinase [Blastococcus sp.]